MLTHEPIVGHWYKRRDGIREKIVRKLDKNPEYPDQLWIATAHIDNPAACANYASAVTAKGRFFADHYEDAKDLVSIDPGDGYRLVEINEIIEDGDEWAVIGGIWKATVLKSGRYKYAQPTPLRRKIKVPAEAPAAPQQADPRFLYTSARADAIKHGGYLVQLFHKNELVHAYVTDTPDFTEIGQNMYFSGPLIRFPNLPPYNPITRV